MWTKITNGILNTIAGICDRSREILLPTSWRIVDVTVPADRERLKPILAAACSKNDCREQARGKSGGYRVVVGYKKHNTERIIFLYAFAKNDKANMSAKEEAVLSLTAESFISTADKQVQELLAVGSIWEVLS